MKASKMRKTANRAIEVFKNSERYKLNENILDYIYTKIEEKSNLGYFHIMLSIGSVYTDDDVTCIINDLLINGYVVEFHFVDEEEGLILEIKWN